MRKQINLNYVEGSVEEAVIKFVEQEFNRTRKQDSAVNSIVGELLVARYGAAVIGQVEGYNDEERRWKCIEWAEKLEGWARAIRVFHGLPSSVPATLLATADGAASSANGFSTADDGEAEPEEVEEVSDSFSDEWGAL